VVEHAVATHDRDTLRVAPLVDVEFDPVCVDETGSFRRDGARVLGSGIGHGGPEDIGSQASGKRE